MASSNDNTPRGTVTAPAMEQVLVKSVLPSLLFSVAPSATYRHDQS